MYFDVEPLLDRISAITRNKWPVQLTFAYANIADSCLDLIKRAFLEGKVWRCHDIALHTEALRHGRAAIAEGHRQWKVYIGSIRG